MRGQHTKAVLYNNVSLQKTKKGTNSCLVLAPLIMCGLLFGLQLAINMLLLDKPEFRVSSSVLGTHLPRLPIYASRVTILEGPRA